jgi:hypothetical protein
MDTLCRLSEGASLKLSDLRFNASRRSTHACTADIQHRFDPSPETVPGVGGLTAFLPSRRLHLEASNLMVSGET